MCLEKLRHHWARLVPRLPALDATRAVDSLVFEASTVQRVREILDTGGEDPLAECWTKLRRFGVLSAAIKMLLVDGQVDAGRYPLLTGMIDLTGASILAYKNQQLWLLLCLLVKAKERQPRHGVSLDRLSATLADVYGRRVLTTKLVFSVHVGCMLPALMADPSRMCDRLAERVHLLAGRIPYMPNYYLPYLCYALAFCTQGAPIDRPMLKIFERKLERQHRKMDLNEVAVVAHLFRQRNYHWPSSSGLRDALLHRLTTAHRTPCTPFAEQTLRNAVCG